MLHSPTQAEFRGKGPDGNDTLDDEETDDEGDGVTPTYGTLGGL